MSRHYAPHQSATAEADVLLKTHRMASSEGVQREIAPLTVASQHLTHLPRSRQQSNAVALSRVAGNRATQQLLQRCASCGGKDDESVQRAFFDDLTNTASSAIGGVGSWGQGVVNDAAGMANTGIGGLGNMASGAVNQGVGMAQSAIGGAANMAGNAAGNLITGGANALGGAISNAGAGTPLGGLANDAGAAVSGLGD